MFFQCFDRNRKGGGNMKTQLFMLSNMCCEGDKVERNEMDGAYIICVGGIWRLHAEFSRKI
jgi:hypothetical protein